MSKADDETKTNEVFRIVAMWIALGAASVLILGYIYFIVKAFDPDIIRNQLKQQPRVTFGIPLAGFVAYCQLLFLKLVPVRSSLRCWDSNSGVRLDQSCCGCYAFWLSRWL